MQTSDQRARECKDEITRWRWQEQFELGSTDTTIEGIIQRHIDEAVQAEQASYRELLKKHHAFIAKSEAEKVELRQRLKDLERGRMELAEQIAREPQHEGKGEDGE